MIWFESRGECSLTVKISSGIFHPPSLPPPHTHTLTHSHSTDTPHTHLLEAFCARSLNFFITVTPGFLNSLLNIWSSCCWFPAEQEFSSSYLLDNPFLNCRPFQVSEPQSLTAKQVEEFSSTCTTFSTCICAVVQMFCTQNHFNWFDWLFGFIVHTRVSEKWWALLPYSMDSLTFWIKIIDNIKKWSKCKCTNIKVAWP